MTTFSGTAFRRAVISVAVGLLVATPAVVLPVGLAAASPLASATGHEPHPLVMGSYSAAGYAAAAARLPGALDVALKRDVGLSAAQYLADSAAAERGVQVVSSLRAAGVHVLGSHMSGTSLTVNIASSADTATVVASGASVAIGAPRVQNFSSVAFHKVSATTVEGGAGYYFVSDGSGYRCSIGFNGYAVATGAAQFVTAGHCATTIDGPAYLLSQPAPTSTGAATTVGPALGATVMGEAQYAAGHDYGIVGEGDAGLAPQPSIETWNGGTGAPMAAAPLAITGQTAAIVGATLCKSGSTSGWTCGTVKDVDTQVLVSNVPVNSIIATTCLLPGDSGGGAVIGQNAVGIDSGSDFGSTCANPQGTLFSAFFPMVSAVGSDSVVGQQSANWELGVSVSKPVVTSPATGATVASSTSISGTLANASSGSTVSVYLDGSSTALAKVSATAGTWSVPLSSVATGAHSYQVIGGWGQHSVSVAATGTFTIGSSGGASSGPPPASVRLHDYSGDGHPDIVVRNTAGALMLYKGNGVGGWAVPTTQTVGAGWNTMSLIIEPGDFNGDGHPDILARDKTGVLWLYPGNGTGGWGASVRVGGGWNSMTAIVAVGDFNGDGHADLVARDSTGALWLYPGNGAGGFLPRTQIGSGWNGMSVIIGAGDFNGDGYPDILARNAAGDLMLYPHTPSGWGTVKQVGSGWNGMTALSSVGDFNGDGTPDIIARNSSGVLWLYPGSGTGSWKATVQLGTGWNQFTAIG